MSWYPSLLAEWRHHASLLRELGAEDHALAVEWCLRDLENRVQAAEDEPLTLLEAEQESGYTYSSLQQRVASGEIQNVGEPGRPRIRRGDLPRKAPRPGFVSESGEPDLAGEILAEKL